MNLTYKIINDGKGYVIKNNGIDWIVQEKYHPYPGGSTEESAVNHINELLNPTETEVPGVDKIKTLEEITAEHEAALVEAFELIAILMEGGNE